MRARFAIPAAVVLVAAVVGDASARSTAVGVSEREFHISLYRHSVPAGTLRFNVTNYGEDAHDLAVIAPSERTAASSQEIRSGRRATLTVRLATPGTYRLLCTKADHAARGMRATLKVRPG